MDSGGNFQSSWAPSQEVAICVEIPISMKKHEKIMHNVVKTIINHPIFDGLYHPFMVILRMGYYCFNHIILERRSW